MKNKSINQKALPFCALLKEIPIAMRITLLLLFVLTFQLQARQIYSQDTKISLDMRNSTIEKVLQAIEEKSDYYFLYNNRFINVDKKVNVRVKNASIAAILEKLLQSENVEYEVKGSQIVLSPKEMHSRIAAMADTQSRQQAVTVSGEVVDQSGNPLPGVTVMVVGMNMGTVTDSDGRFSITIPAEAKTLRFSFVGMRTQEVVIDGKTRFRIVMVEESIGIEEVVVTALGIERNKRSLSYATELVDVTSISDIRDPSLATSLSGKIAGVSISNASGASGVGGSSRIIIRGNKSINRNNQPLIVVDGIPYNNSKGVTSTDKSTREVDSFDGFSNINPDDIQSINVLKGPAAAALYGSAANNGVIIVTTKKGRMGKPQVEFNSITTMDFPYLYPDLQNEYAQGSGGVYSASIDAKSWGPKMTGQKVTNWTGEEVELTPQPNNVKDFFVNGYNLTNSLSYSAGNERSSTYFSYSNTTARGMLKTDKLERHNFNLRLNAELIPNLRLDFKITAFKQDMDSRPASGDDYFSPMQNLLRMPRSLRTQDLKDFEYYTEEGSLKQNIWVPGGTSTLNNPYWSLYRRIAPTSRNRITTFTSLKYDFTNWLSAQVRVAMDAIHDDAEEKIYWDAIYINDGKGNYYTAFRKSQDITSDFMINARKELSNGIALSAMIGGEIKDSKARGQSASTNGLTVENKFALNFGSSNTTSDSESRVQTQSIFGTAQVAFKEMVYLDLTARNDWNSTLPPPYDYFYPSIGLTGIISEMVKLPEFISFAKLRGSYAEVGNGVGFASIFQTYGRNTDGPIGQITTSGTKVAEQLIPEKTKSLEVGGEFRFMGNRLGLDITWYKSNTINQLISITAPPTSGYTSTQINCGNIQNKGIEVMLSARPLERRDFTWDTYLTFSRNINKVLELYKGVERYELSTANLALGNNWVIVGRPYGEIYSRTFQRDAQGRIIVSDNGLPIITADADHYLGNYNYDWQSGLSNSFSYKNWHLNFLIDLNYGGIRTSATESMLMLTGGSKATLYGREGFIFDGVKEDGTPNDITINAEAYGTLVGGRSSNNGPVELFTHDATNSRLRELSLGYDLPVKSNLISALRISLVGRNLIYLYNGCKWFDPDVTYNTGANGQGAENSFLPGARTLGLNLKLTF
jgi:TonB-linked SusC/RagA family outer membrane protein